MSSRFSAKVETLEPYGLTQIVLEHSGQTVKILPEMGSNLYSYTVEGQELLAEPRDIMEKGVKYGIPVLFPTPNRVKNGVFEYKGRSYPQVKGGKAVLIHGLVCDEPWEYEDVILSEKEARVTTFIEVEQDHPVYASFPFPFRLSITYHLSLDGLLLQYSLENRGSEVLPFGFALHPFFSVIDKLENIQIQVPVPYVMEAFDCMPTGEILEVAGTRYDLRDFRELGDLDVDDVYWKLDQNKEAVIAYKGLGRKLILQASDDFSHMVVYTPLHRQYFCLENQTSSTDAHNMVARGKEEVSGLIFLEPARTHEGWVRFRPTAL